MKVLAISDFLFTDDLIDIAVKPARGSGADVEVRKWAFPSRGAQQEQMLAVEQRGPAAVPAPEALVHGFDHDILIVQFAPVSGAVLEQAPNLRLVIVNRAGLENIDLEVAARLGIVVRNSPGRNTEAVAEYTLALILAEQRNLARGHQFLKADEWTEDYPNSGWIPELRGKTVGFVGYGRIGRRVHDLIRPFGCTFVAYDPYLADAPDDLVPVTLPELMHSADVITLHARLTPESRHLIGAAELALAKPTAILVNTARAGLVDEVALAQALSGGRLGGAALDVFEHEPVAGDDPLVRSERTTVTPHLAGNTVDGFTEGPRIVGRTLRQALDNWPPSAALLHP